MNRIALFSSAALCLLTGNAFAQFSGSNLVVSVVDSGTAAAPTGVATQVHLVAYSRVNGRDVLPTGQTYDLPTVLSGLNHRLTESGSATSEGQLSVSADGNYLLLVGYDAALGTAAVSATTSATVNRVVGRIDWTQPPATAIDTTTALNNIFSGNSIRGAASPDGQTFYLSGSGGTQGGVALATLGATTGTPSYGGTTSKTLRNIGLFGGNLYVSGATSAGPLYGVGLVTSGSTTQLPGFPTTTGPSPYQFYFLDKNTLYVADDRATSAGGIQKWQNFGGTWTLEYTFNIPAVSGTGIIGARGLAGSPFYDEDTETIYAELFAVTADNQIITLIDDSPGAEMTVIDKGTTGKIFRGVTVIPPKTVTIGGMVTIPGVDLTMTPLPVNVTVTFRPLDGVSPTFTRTVTVASDSTYTVTGVPAGTAYQLHVKADNTLAGNHNVNTYSEDDIDADVTLQPGDATNDNVVDTSDFNILAGDFGAVYDPNVPNSVTGYDPRADFNYDGMIDTGDFNLLVGSFGQTGDM